LGDLWFARRYLWRLLSCWIWGHVIWYSVTDAKPIFVVTLAHAAETRTDMVILRYISRRVNYKDNQNRHKCYTQA
jgi:hypothetical protein